jgi:hypothetical protein
MPVPMIFYVCCVHSVFSKQYGESAFGFLLLTMGLFTAFYVKHRLRDKG